MIVRQNRYPAKWPVPSDVDVLEVNGYPLAYQDSGTGPPLVLIHGSLNDYRSWTFQVPDFARSFRVLALSLRHYYPEQWNGRGDDFSLAQHAADVSAFVRLAKLPKVHMLGHSRGGAVAYLVARDQSELLRSLVLADPRGVEGLLPQTPEARAMAGQTAALFERLHHDLKSRDATVAAQTFVDTLGGPGAWKRRSPGERRMLLDNIATAVDTGELPGITCADVAGLELPILLVTGASSPQRYREGFAAMRACNPTIAESVTLHGASHRMHRDNPAAFNAAILGFLDAIGRNQAGNACL